MAQNRSSTSAEHRKPYWLVSRFYDELWPNRSKAWRAARRRLLDPVLKRSQTICELGCGTGTNSIEFARRGLKVYAVGSFRGHVPGHARKSAEETRETQRNTG